MLGGILVDEIGELLRRTFDAFCDAGQLVEFDTSGSMIGEEQMVEGSIEGKLISSQTLPQENIHL